MPNPTPTQEERDQAIVEAQTYPSEILAKCHLHATAELARAEERIRRLRRAIEAQNDSDCALWVGAAINQDDKLARGESEETKMEPVPQSEFDTLIAVAPKFTPKPGDRVRLESSPDRHDQDLVGRIGVLQRTSDPMDERVYWTMLVEPNGRDYFLHRDAVFAPAPAQAEQPPAVASRGEVTDYQPPSNFELADIRYKAEKGQSERDAAGNRALFDAGRDSRADDMATVLDASQIIANTNKMLHGVIQKRDAEVAELKREVGTLGLELESARTVSDTLRQELEAEKAAHREAARAWAGAHSRAAQNARAVPSVAQVVDVLDRLDGGDDCHARWERQAKAVLALFASPPASPDNGVYYRAPDTGNVKRAPSLDNTPPEPLPEVLPSGTRFDWGGRCGVTTSEVRLVAVGNLSAYQGNAKAVHPVRGILIPEQAVTIMRKQIDWARWRSQQNQGPTGQKEGENVTVCDPEILRVGAPAAEAASDIETVRGAGAAACPGTAGERGNRGESPQAAGGERLRGPSGVVDQDPGSPGSADAAGIPNKADADGPVFTNSAQPGDASLSDESLLQPPCEGLTGTELAAQSDRARLEAEGKKQCPVYFDLCTGCAVCDETMFDEEDARLSGQGRSQPTPSPDAGLEAVKAEVAELRTLLDELHRIVGERFKEVEIQGRVTRRLIEHVNREELFPATVARIEREEREAAGKAP